MGLLTLRAASIFIGVYVCDAGVLLVCIGRAQVGLGIRRYSSTGVAWGCGTRAQEILLGCGDILRGAERYPSVWICLVCCACGECMSGKLMM